MSEIIKNQPQVEMTNVDTISHDIIKHLRAQLAEAQGEIGRMNISLELQADRVDKLIDENVKAEAELAKEQHENEQLIILRDEYEELVGNVALILGCTDEWSNCHDHRCCIAENATRIVRENAALREQLKKMEEAKEYKDHEFCKDVECTALEYNACNAYVCYKTAKHFHRWLEQNGYAIVKAIKAVCEGK